MDQEPAAADPEAPPPRPSRLRRLFRVALAVVYVPVAAEVFLRVLAPQPIVPRYITATSYGIRGNMPNMVYEHKTPDIHITVRTNSKGIRADREIPYEKPSGLSRIVALGDSFGMGYEVDLKDSFLTRMTEDLERAGKTCEVVNLSVSGHGTAEELLALREEGFRYDPDIVLVCWHPTDLDDNVRSGLFKIEDGNLARGRREYLPGVKTRLILHKFFVYRWLEAHSHLYSFLREWAGATTKELLVKFQKPAKAKGKAKDAPRPMPVPTEADKPPEPRPLNRQEILAVALLRQIHEECEQRGIAMLTLDIPGQMGRGRYRSDFPADLRGGDFGLIVVRPLETFLGMGQSLIYNERSHAHFTPMACRIVGGMLAREILDHGLLSRAASLGEQAGPRSD